MNSVLKDLRDVPVEVICLSVSPPVISRGRLSSTQDPSICELVFDATELELRPGMRVVLNGGPDREVRIKGRIQAVQEDRLEVVIEQVVPRDKRSFPRMHGGIRLRYRVLRREEEALVSTWLGGDQALAREGTWREPDPFMDFSGTGLRFEDELHCALGDVLVMELGIPSGGGPWRGAARVVRIESIRPEELETMEGKGQKRTATHRIAVSFLHLPSEAVEALTEFGMRIQEALLDA